MQFHWVSQTSLVSLRRWPKCRKSCILSVKEITVTELNRVKIPPTFLFFFWRKQLQMHHIWELLHTRWALQKCHLFYFTIICLYLEWWGEFAETNSLTLISIAVSVESYHSIFAKCIWNTDSIQTGGWWSELNYWALNFSTSTSFASSLALTVIDRSSNRACIWR